MSIHCFLVMSLLLDADGKELFEAVWKCERPYENEIAKFAFGKTKKDGLYPDRTSGGHCHHRHPGQHAAAGAGARERIRQSHQMQQSPERVGGEPQTVQ